MALKTNFSFEVQYPADSSRSQAQQDQMMDSLQTILQQLLTAQDSEAEVVVSDSHRGNGNKLAELTTSLEDASLAAMLKGFSDQHGVSITALE